MKKYIYLLLSISLFLTAISCTKEESSDDQEFFEYKYENNDVSITQWEVVKNGDRFVIQAMGSGKNFAIELDEYGHLASAASYSTTDMSFPLSESFEYYSSYSFHINSFDIDVDNKMIKVSFDGLLYEDNYDIDSTTHNVSGKFNLKYAEVTETALSKMFCKIDSNDWRETDGSNSFSGSYEIEMSAYNDDAYILHLNFNTSNITTCNNQPFNDNSSLKMYLDIYDPQNDDFIYCPSNGIISITNHTAPTRLSYGFVEGTFSFTAVNSNTNQTYTINNGTFIQYYR